MMDYFFLAGPDHRPLYSPSHGLDVHQLPTSATERNRIIPRKPPDPSTAESSLLHNTLPHRRCTVTLQPTLITKQSCHASLLVHSLVPFCSIPPKVFFTSRDLSVDAVRAAMFVYTMFSCWRAAPRRKGNVSILIYFYDIPAFLWRWGL